MNFAERISDFLVDHPAYLVTIVPEILAILYLNGAKTPELQHFYETIAIALPVLATSFEVVRSAIRKRY